MSDRQLQLAQSLALWHIPGFGAKRLHTVLTDPEVDCQQLFTEPRTFEQHLQLTPALIAAISAPPWREVEAALTWANQAEHHIITCQQSSYPYYLLQIGTPPPILYICGNLSVLQTPQLAMVGSRNPSAHGRDIAYQFASDLTGLPLTITSGLALGIDAASHQGALANNGKTIAVLGSGLGQIYPARHQQLATDIIAGNGAVISEFPLHAQPKSQHFPRRNRIISGLSLGTLVVEAALQSGSLITARFAAEQNREVFAIPGSIHNPLSKGCHALIRQGAKLVETIVDIIDELQGYFSAPIPAANSVPSQALPNMSNLSLQQKNILNSIDYTITPMDTIAQRAGLSIAEIAHDLLQLEMNDLIANQIGGYFRK
ncbi:MAG: DNA-processing protein DprA [Gammaproteobacteria bacterium]